MKILLTKTKFDFSIKTRTSFYFLKESNLELGSKLYLGVRLKNIEIFEKNN